MRGFYYNETNYNKLYNEISIMLSDDLIDSGVAESWLEDFYVADRYNTTRAVEKYISDNIINEIENNDINKNSIINIINSIILKMRMKDMVFKPMCNKIETLDKIRMGFVTESIIIEVLEEFDVIESLEYLKEGLLNNNSKNKFIIKDSNIREILRILESIKRLVRILSPSTEEFDIIKEKVYKLMYIYKHCEGNNKSKLIGFKQGINIHEVDSMTSSDISLMFSNLEKLINTQSDKVIEYIISELKYIIKLIEHTENSINYVEESININDELYMEAVNKFNNLMESIFLDEESDEIDLKDLVKIQNLAEAICEYESNMEASSRIITKGTEKITKGIGNVSAKSGGMSSSQSKIGQLKRGVKIVDDRASGAINKKLDDIMNITRDAKREKLITGKNTVKLGKALKTAISIIVTKKGATKLLGPLWGTVASIITMLGAYALSKRTGERERKRILLELETELKIVKEKIEDAKGDNARQEKYQLMRIQANLEKEITRIKHGLRYY